MIAPACRFAIPRPPSTNNLHGSHIDWKTGKMRRHNTRAYKAWIDAAGWSMKVQQNPLPHFDGEVEIEIAGLGGIDIDNTKAIPDLLKRLGILNDDKQVAKQTTTRVAPTWSFSVDDGCLLSIWELETDLRAKSERGCAGESGCSGAQRRRVTRAAASQPTQQRIGRRPGVT